MNDTGDVTRRFMRARADVVAALGPIYHDFSLLGLPTHQIPGIFAPNQRAKAPIIVACIARAIAALRARSESEISLLEMFCADAYYAMVAKAFGADRVVAIDDNRDGYLETAFRVRDALGLEIELRCQAVERLDPAERFSIVVNAGGLYHVDDPETVLDTSRKIATDYLIVQNVVSLANDDPAYFEAPAPGLPRGNRYSRASFERAIAQRGWSVIDVVVTELPGNSRSEDRGSVTFLIDATSGR